MLMELRWFKAFIPFHLHFNSLVCCCWCSTQTKVNQQIDARTQHVRWTLQRHYGYMLVGTFLLPLNKSPCRKTAANREERERERGKRTEKSNDLIYLFENKRNVQHIVAATVHLHFHRVSSHCQFSGIQTMVWWLVKIVWVFTLNSI